MNIQALVRKNILSLTPYSSARDEFVGDAEIFLDANENPFPTPYNRYPDPLQQVLKNRLAELKGIKPAQLFLGNGSDEPIDLLIRAFCEPSQDSILITPPTYGMYKVCADINGVKVQEVPLTDTFQLDVTRIDAVLDRTTKLIFLCSPNNPTGNLLNEDAIKKIITTFTGLVVIDEAYIDFSSFSGFSQYLNDYPNLVILQTLSKAWGLAGLRLGMCFASTEIIGILNKIKYPYNINASTQSLVLEKLKHEDHMRTNVAILLSEKVKLRELLSELPLVDYIYPSDANFLLVRVANAKKIYSAMLQKGIILRDRSNVVLCENCLRITIGTPDENKILLKQLESLTL